MARKMIDPKPYIALVDALNEVDALVKSSGLHRMGVVFQGQASNFGTELDLNGHYSVQYDSEADRWTLVSETDDAPDLCSFNQDTDECRGLDRCEQCQEVAEKLAEQYDEDVARRGY